MERNVVSVDSRTRGMYAKLEFMRGSIRLRRLTSSPDSTLRLSHNSLLNISVDEVGLGSM